MNSRRGAALSALCFYVAGCNAIGGLSGLEFVEPGEGDAALDTTVVDTSPRDTSVDSKVDSSIEDTTKEDTFAIDDGVDAKMDGDDASVDTTDATLDTSVVDSMLVDTAVPDTAMPDTTTPPDTFVPDTATPPDTFVPDTVTPPDTFVLDTFVLDTFVPDTFVPDTFVPDTFVPDTGPPLIGPVGMSCAGGLTCAGVSCCETRLVPGGSFPMGRSVSGTDAFTPGETYEQPEHTVAIDSLYLDTYEVTVSRFRKFVNAYTGVPPTAGAGAHPKIAGTGWQSAWNFNLATTQATLKTRLASCSNATWREPASTTENKPINCVDWYEAFAFCIWDGGRLPTEAEWEYTAAGGNENRLWPWGAAVHDSTRAAYRCLFNGGSSCEAEDLAPVGSLPLGKGRYGQYDLAGNVYEWVLDALDPSWYSGGGAGCTSNCANVPGTGGGGGYRGGGYDDNEAQIRPAFRAGDPPTLRFHSRGFRCAKNP